MLGICLVLDGGMFSSWSQLIGVTIALPAVVAGAWIWLRSRRSPRISLADPLNLSMAIWLAALLVSFVFSVYRWVSLVELCKAVAAISLFCVASRFLSSSVARHRLVTILFWTVTGVALLGLVLYYARSSETTIVSWLVNRLRVVNDNRLAIVFGYPNTFAAFLLVPLAGGVGLAIVATGWKRIAYIAGIATLVAGLLASGSRGGLLVFIVMALAIPLAMAGASGWTHASRRRVGSVYGGIAAGAVFILLVPPLRHVLLEPVLGRLAGAIAELAAGGALESGLRGRATMIADGFRYFRAYPLFGSGGGTYPSVYMRFRTTMFFSSDPHSLIIKALTETGIVGGLSLGWLLIMILRRSWRGAVAAGGEQSLAVAVWMGMGALLLHACIDWDFCFFLVPVMLALLQGACAGEPSAPVEKAASDRAVTVASIHRNGSKLSASWVRRAVSGMVWLAVACMVLTSALLTVSALIQLSAARRGASDSTTGLALYHTASVLDPLNAENYYHRAMLNVAIDRLVPAGPVSSRGLDIRKDFGKAIRLNPQYPPYRISYARFLLGYRLTDAVAQYRSLVDLDSADPGTYTGLGIAYLKVYENVDEAEQWIAKALSLDQSYAEAHWAEGMVLEQQGLYGRAAAEYQAAADLDKVGTEALVSLGAMYEGHGDWLQAVHAFAEAHARNPSDAEIAGHLNTMAPIVDIISPTAGLGVPRGQEMKVAWTVSGKSDLVDSWSIYLDPAKGEWVVLAADIPPLTREWMWRIPMSLTEGAYRLIIQGYAPSPEVPAGEAWVTFSTSGNINIY